MDKFNYIDINNPTSLYLFFGIILLLFVLLVITCCYNYRNCRKEINNELEPLL